MKTIRHSLSLAALALAAALSASCASNQPSPKFQAAIDSISMPPGVTKQHLAAVKKLEESDGDRVISSKLIDSASSSYTTASQRTSLGILNEPGEGNLIVWEEGDAPAFWAKRFYTKQKPAPERFHFSEITVYQGPTAGAGYLRNPSVMFIGKKSDLRNILGQYLRHYAARDSSTT